VLEQRSAVVGLVDDDELALRLAFEIERDDHARKDENGIRVGPEKGTGHPTVRVRALAEAGDLSLDAGQVLEVRRGCEEEDVDGVFAHSFAQTAPSLRVIEHAARV
jgi:hypothetical protein